MATLTVARRRHAQRKQSKLDSLLKTLTEDMSEEDSAAARRHMEALLQLKARSVQQQEEEEVQQEQVDKENRRERQAQRTVVESVESDGLYYKVKKDWLETKKKLQRVGGEKVEQHTMKSYRTALFHFERLVRDSVDLDNPVKILITPDVVQQFVDDFRDEDTVSNSTIKHYLRAISIFAKYLEDKRYCQKNICDGVKPPRQRKKKTSTRNFNLERADIRKLIDACDFDFQKNLIRFLYFFGLRAFEVIAIKGAHVKVIEDEDKEHDILQLKGVLGKANKVVQMQLPITNPDLRELAKCANVEGYLFPSREKGVAHMGKSTLTRILKAAAVKTGYQTYTNKHGELTSRITPHFLRHAAGTHMSRHVGNGQLNERDLANFMRHSSVRTTKRFYVHAREAGPMMSLAL